MTVTRNDSDFQKAIAALWEYRETAHPESAPRKETIPLAEVEAAFCAAGLELDVTGFSRTVLLLKCDVPVAFRCPLCGRQGSMEPRGVLYAGERCPRCRGDRQRAEKHREREQQRQAKARRGEQQRQVKTRIAESRRSWQAWRSQTLAEQQLRAAGWQPLETCRSRSGPVTCRCLICGDLGMVTPGPAPRGHCLTCLSDELEGTMRAAGFAPLELYPGSTAPWSCRCLTCGKVSQPRYHNVKRGSGCRYCHGGRRGIT